MTTVGVAVDKDALSQFFKALGETSVPNHVAAGSKKLVSMPSGGGARAAAPTGGAAAGKAAEPVKEEKKEEAADVNMGGLFGDDDEY